jgi:hypothetical protein
MSRRHRDIVITILFIVIALGSIASAFARDRNVPLEFQRHHPCPSTGKTTGRCPGYVRDHVVPLCKGGADSPSNMQWQTVRDGKAKDRWECRR